MRPMNRTQRLFPRLFVIGMLVCATNGFAQTIDDENREAAGYYSRQQWDETIVAFRTLISRYPDTPEARTGHFFLGEALMQTDQFDEAYRIYQIFLQKTSDHSFAPRATFRMGEAAFRIGNFEPAIRMLEIFFHEHPADPLNEFALFYLGEMRLKRIEPQLAQRVFEQALQQYPHGVRSNQCRLGLAQAFQLQGAFSEAIRFYQFISQQADNPLAGEAELQIAIIYVNQADLESAKRHLIKSVPLCTTDESRSTANYWLARVYAQEGNFSEAFALLESVAGKSAPDVVASAVYFDGAIAARKLEKNDLAFEWLTLLIDKYPHSNLADDALNLKIELSRVSTNATQRNEFENLVRQFLQQFPHSPLKLIVLETAGRFHYTNQQYSKSVKAFEQLLADDIPADSAVSNADRANWHYLHSLGLIGLGRFADAETVLNQVDVTAASEQLQPLFQLAMATSRLGQQKFQHAIPNFRNYLQQAGTLKSAPLADLLRARTELTICLAESGLWSEADLAFKELQLHHAADPVVLETADYLADRAIRDGQPTIAAHWLEFMVSAGGDSTRIPRVVSSLAWINLESGDWTKAKPLFERLVNDFPDDELTGPAAMALAKKFDDDRDFPAAAQMYGLVIRSFGETELAKIARLRRAHALQKIGAVSDLKEAKTLLQEYLAMPGEIVARDEALYQLAWVNFDLGLSAESNENFQTLLRECPQSKYRSDVAFRIAQDQLQQTQFSAASTTLESLLQQTNTPESVRVRALYLQGELAAKQNHWDIVVQTMSSLLTSCDDPALETKAQYWLAEAHYRQQHFEQAAEILGKLREKHAALDEKLRPWIWLRLAQCLGQQHQWSEAMEVANAGIAQFRNFSADYEFNFICGRGLEEIGKLTDARASYQLVIDSPAGGSTETAAISQWRIGETFFHQENYRDAINAYYKVDSLFSFANWRSAALLQAGKCQEHLGNWIQAKKLYTRLMEQFPNSTYAGTAKERLERVNTLAKVETKRDNGTQ